ncbi:MAG: formylglycine-generating enzyme family protein [Anaerolineales bacterium]|nr:formylglycine-generating enzyme family protein [Anaerolineales bacterium]
MYKSLLFTLIILTFFLTSCANSPTPTIGSTEISNADGMTLVYVPAGEFRMGSAESDVDAADDEKPMHPVYLDAYWIDQTEVTNGMYNKCLDADACTLPVLPSEAFFQNPNQPVQGLAWTQAFDYCEWAGRRLPTEAEWEKAARGTDERLFPWGNTLLDEPTANYDFIFNQFIDVGTLPSGASPYGVYDMAGNVWEWTADWYDEDYYASSAYENPAGPTSGNIRVIRGGAWNTVLRAIRVTNRHWAFPGRDDIVGFRCAK